MDVLMVQTDRVSNQCKITALTYFAALPPWEALLRETFSCTSSTLKRTVLLRGRHSPIITSSPGTTSKHGDCVLHEASVHNTTKKLSANAHITGEWAFLVDVATFSAFTGILNPRPAEWTAREPLREERDNLRHLPANMCGCFWYALSVCTSMMRIGSPC